MEVYNTEGKLLYKIDSKHGLVGANLEGAYLYEADLIGDDLIGANLRGATYGKGVPLTRAPLQIIGLPYPVLIFDSHVKIGCQLHTTDRWERFTKDDVSLMDDDSASMWKYRDLILTAAKLHQGAIKND